MAEVDTITVKDSAGTDREVPTLLSLEGLVGEVQTTPTANTVLDRLKTIADAVGATLTVDGTITANLSSTDNAVLDAIVSALGGTLTVDGSGSTQPVSGTVTANLSATDNAVLDAIQTAVEGALTIGQFTDGDYETVAASQTDQALGATGATGDYLSGVLIVPATTSPGAVAIQDGAGSAITIFTGGTDSVSNLVPFFVPLGMVSGAGAWQITTGTNVSAIGMGNFT